MVMIKCLDLEKKKEKNKKLKEKVKLDRSFLHMHLGSSGVINSLKNVCEKLTHLHKGLYTWWCWHICKGAVGEEKELNASVTG